MSAARAVVAGHLCLDILPALRPLSPAELQAALQPGRLLEVGPAAFTTGGLVANAGLVLHRLGIETTLIGKIGADLFGEAVRAVIRASDPRLLDGIVVDPQVHTSYTLILNPPGTDRIFLHYTGANETFCAGDVDFERVRRAALFHFGYPPILRQMYREGGAELVSVLRAAQATGATTSLDLSLPDASSESGRADWRAILGRALPYTDLFAPSVEELLYMTRPGTYWSWFERGGAGGLVDRVTPELLSELGAELIDWGVKILVIKLGERGLYLRTAGRDALERLGRAQPEDLDAWTAREVWAPSYQVRVAGTTGAGDAAIAGFLAALLRGRPPREAVDCAAAAGAWHVETAGAPGGMPDWEALLARLRSGWARHPLVLDHPGWAYHPVSGVWIGPHSSDRK